jgi:microcompartment protein CcmL/EutN
MEALGLIETRGLIAAIESADAMLKAADVTLLEKTYVGGGLVSIAITGGVSAVKAAVEAGSAAVKQIDSTLLVSEHVIPRPHEEVNNLIVMKPLKNMEIQNVESIKDESQEQDAAVVAIATQDFVTDDLTPVQLVAEAKEPISLEIGLDEINKDSIDKLVFDYGWEKVHEVLSRIKVTKLRNLARKYMNLGIAGRIISKADRKMLLNEFEEYYRKNK